MAADEHDETQGDESGEHEAFGRRRERNDGRLRSAMLDDGQPWLPWWIAVPGVALALGWAAYHGVTADEPGLAPFLATLTWPGIPIFIVTTITTYFGWRLDLD